MTEQRCKCSECLEYEFEVASGETNPDDVYAFFRDIDEPIMAYAMVKLKPDLTARVLMKLKLERETNKCSMCQILEQQRDDAWRREGEMLAELDKLKAWHADRTGVEERNCRAYSTICQERDAAKRALSYALHAFRARISTHADDKGLARGELACMIGLGEEMQHVKMGRLSYVEEDDVRKRLEK